MPLFTESQTLETHKIGHFGYSAVPLDELEAAQFTLATIVVDRSGSTGGFTQEMTNAVKAAVEALKRHPLKDQMLLRVIAFDSQMEEIHGFIPVGSINCDQYDGCFSPRGVTALFDACISAVEAIESFSASLASKKYLNNAIVVVVTDGLNNDGKFSRPGDVVEVKRAFTSAMQRESLESLATILIAVGYSQWKDELNKFHTDSGFTNPLIGVEQATPDAIARIGNFITSSISSTSMVLGTGGPSQSLNF